MALIMEVCDRIHVLDQGSTLAEGAPGEIRANLDVAAAYLGEDAPALGHERDARARNLLGRAPAQRLAREPDLARARRHEPHDRVQRRRLARAVRPDEPDDLAAPDLDRE